MRSRYEGRGRVRLPPPRLVGRRLSAGDRGGQSRGSGIRCGRGVAGERPRGAPHRDPRRRAAAGGPAGRLRPRAGVQLRRGVPGGFAQRVRGGRRVRDARLALHRVASGGAAGGAQQVDEQEDSRVSRDPVPEFATFHPGEAFLRPSALRYPLIVKPLLEDASLGIAQSSVVTDDGGLAERVGFIHEKFSQAAIAEELIEGRELSVGLVGNDPLTMLPVVELHFGKLSKAERRIATYKAKWDEEYRERHHIRSGFARRLSEAVVAKIRETCETAFHALWLQDYGRIDLRLTHDHEVYVLEGNPNPFIAYGHELANSAEKAGMKYNEFIQRIVDEAMKR